MRYKKTMTVLVTASVLIVCLLFTVSYYIVQAATAISIDEDELYFVTQVKDGDTFDVKVGRREMIVRMLGVDTPETVDPRKPVQCYGKEASDETKSLLIGQKVRLKLNPNREEKDKYGRYLAYVYLDEASSTQDLFVNEFLLENGYAREYTYGTPYMFQKEFREIEKVAKEARRGLWGVCEVSDSRAKKAL